MPRHVFEDIDERDFEREDRYRRRSSRITKNERTKETNKWNFFKPVRNTTNEKAEMLQ
jgi:hypothetical protein